MCNRELSDDVYNLKNSTLHPSANIQTLNEFKSRVSLHIPFKSNRQAILNLYTGSTKEIWLQNELSDCFKILTEHKSGIKFIHDIARKSRSFSSQFIKTALDYRNILFSNSYGELLFSILIPFLSESTQVNIFYEIYPKLFQKESESFKQFANTLIWNSASNNGVQKILLSANWESLYDHIEYLRSLIEGSSTESALKIIQSLPIPKSIQYAAALKQMIIGFSQNAASILIEQFKPQFVTLLLSPIAYPIAQGMIGACSVTELREFALMVDSNMPESFPGHFDIVLPSLLIALPYKDRQAVLEKWEKHLFSPRFPLISRVYKYNKILEQKQGALEVECK